MDYPRRRRTLMATGAALERADEGDRFMLLSSLGLLATVVGLVLLVGHTSEPSEGTGVATDVTEPTALAEKLPSPAAGTRALGNEGVADSSDSARDISSGPSGCSRDVAEAVVAPLIAPAQST